MKALSFFIEQTCSDRNIGHRARYLRVTQGLPKALRDNKLSPRPSRGKADANSKAARGKTREAVRITLGREFVPNDGIHSPWRKRLYFPLSNWR
jgi:hypothetical protein